MSAAVRLRTHRAVEAMKRRLKTSAWLRSIPLLRYTYVLDASTAITVPELAFNFVPTPKVANRSMKAAIASVVWPGYRGDPHLAGWRQVPVSTLRANGYFGFGFVRNPLDRLYSCYVQKIVFYGRIKGLPLVFWRYGNMFWPEMSFAEFVETVASIPDRISDPHFRSQHRFLYHNGTPVVDFIGRFETLQRDWASLRRQFNLPELPHHNRSPHRPFTDAYNPETARLAANRYEKDIELFGYEDEVAPLLVRDLR